MNIFFKRVVTGGAVAISGIALFCLSKILFAAVICAMVSYAAVVELPRVLSVYSLGYWAVLCIGILIPFGSFMYMMYPAQDTYTLFFLIGAAAVFDTFSYGFGTVCGHYKIAPSISPGKTWEGLGGGCVALGLYVWWYMAYVNQVSISKGLYLLLVAGLAGAAFAGDLFESWLKRRAGLKDIGTLLPGHGGILDRIDSLLAIFVMWLLVLRHFLS